MNWDAIGQVFGALALVFVVISRLPEAAAACRTQFETQEYGASCESK